MPIFGEHPIMMEKSALTGKGGGCTPTPFQPITITYKVAVYAQAAWEDKHYPSFISTTVCTLWWSPILHMLLTHNEAIFFYSRNYEKGKMVQLDIIYSNYLGKT